jgi:rare lipoprotein A
MPPARTIDLPMWPEIHGEPVVYEAFAVVATEEGTTSAAMGEQIIPPLALDEIGTPRIVERGIASWYRDCRTASGEPYRRTAYTAAHRTLPFDSRVRVRNLDNGREVIVRITDRGPYVDGRIIDLAEAAAREIGLLQPGLARVEIEVIWMP